MRLISKISLSLCLVWGALLCTMYLILHGYFLNNLLQIAGVHDSQEIQINHYAISQLVSYYQVVFIFLGLLFAGLGIYILRLMLARHLSNFNNQLHAIHHAGDYVKRIRLDEKDEYYFAAKLFNHMMDTIQTLQTQLADARQVIEQSFSKINVLEGRVIKADKADPVLHAVSDLLNSITTSMYVVREKYVDLPASQWADEKKYLTEEMNLLNKNLVAVDEMIKSYES